MNTVHGWHFAGDWFDICSCNIPCPCEFAQAPTNNACAGMLAWHIRQGHYGDVRLDGLNLLGLATFEGNVWTDEAKVRMASSSPKAPMKGSAWLCRRSSRASLEDGRQFSPRRSVSSAASSSCP
jgi:hypothetical protein